MKNISVDSIYFRSKDVVDTSNRVLDRLSYLNVTQFRELFVQEVFPEKQLNKDLKYIDKKKDLSLNPTNKIQDTTIYWTNTPLKTTKAH